MNETALYLCNNVQGCKFAYVQSDEISLILTDFETPETDSFLDIDQKKFYHYVHLQQHLNLIN